MERLQQRCALEARRGRRGRHVHVRSDLLLATLPAALRLDLADAMLGEDLAGAGRQVVGRAQEHRHRLRRHRHGVDGASHYNCMLVQGLARRTLCA